MKDRTRDAWDFGIHHRERLVHEYMDREGMTIRPMLKDIVDALIEEVQGARLREDVLPLDRYAQTELVSGRVEVTVNSRIGAIKGVKHVAGIAHVAKWHESVHVARDFLGLSQATEMEQPALPGLNNRLPQLVACRGFNETLTGERKANEFFAEMAGMSAAVCGEDLNQCPAYKNLVRRAATGGELGASGWSQVYTVAEVINVNPSAVVKFLEYNGIARVIRHGGGNRLFGNEQLRMGGG